ncbi:hypothetical protein MIDIC_110066 [Alphaproteobacteria bacterium]
MTLIDEKNNTKFQVHYMTESESCSVAVWALEGGTWCYYLPPLPFPANVDFASYAMPLADISRSILFQYVWNFDIRCMPQGIVYHAPHNWHY